MKLIGEPYLDREERITLAQLVTEGDKMYALPTHLARVGFVLPHLEDGPGPVIVASDNHNIKHWGFVGVARHNNQVICVIGPLSDEVAHNGPCMFLQVEDGVKGERILIDSISCERQLDQPIDAIVAHAAL